MANKHYAVIDPYRRRLRVEYKGEVVAETVEALILKEVSSSVYNPVFYVPKKDISARLIMEATPKGHCPLKGDAHRWHLVENPTAAYFGWSYEDPFPAVGAIRGHIAFNLGYVTLISSPVEEAAG